MITKQRNLYECKVVHTEVNERGEAKRVKETVVTEAETISQAEMRVLSYMVGCEDISVTKISSMPVTAYIADDARTGDEMFFIAMVDVTELDENTAKEKVIKYKYLVRAMDILAVNRLIKEFMLMSDYEISRIAHKNYVEVLFGEDVE